MRDNAYEYWREYCHRNHFHGFANETVQPQSTHSCQLVLLAGEITHIGSNHAE
jgi:hypothetical protein